MPESASGEGGCLLRGVSALAGVSSGGVSALGVCLLWAGVCFGGVCSRGCLLQGGVCSWGGVVSQHALRQTPPSPVNRMTDRCKNITLATTSLRPVKIMFSLTFCTSVSRRRSCKCCSSRILRCNHNSSRCRRRSCMYRK